MPRTVVSRTGLLLSVFISGSFATRMAVSVRSPGVGVLTIIVTVALALFVIVPRLHVITPDELAQVPRLLLREINCTPAGRIFVKNTPVKAVRQLLFTCSV